MGTSDGWLVFPRTHRRRPRAPPSYRRASTFRHNTGTKGRAARTTDGGKNMKPKPVHKSDPGVFYPVARCAGAPFLGRMNSSRTWAQVTCKRCLKYRPGKK